MLINFGLLLSNDISNRFGLVVKIGFILINLIVIIIFRTLYMFIEIVIVFRLLLLIMMAFW